jgi:hypothetical protein
MTVAEKHIGLDLILKVLKSDIYGSFQDDQKDYFLNLAVLSIIKEKTENIRDRYSMKDNVPLVRTFYSEIGNLLIKKSYATLGQLVNGQLVVATPRVDNVEVDSGYVLNGEQYLVLERGSTDFSSVTSATLKNGSIFTIVKSGDSRFDPSWDGITTLERISDPFMFMPLMVSTNVVTDIQFSKGRVIKGVKYFTISGIVTSDKAITLLSALTTTSSDVILTAKNTGTFIGDLGAPTVTPTVIGRLDTIPANILMPTEHPILDMDPASRGTNPIAIYENNALSIYCDNDIHDMTLTYIKMPRKINSSLNIDTDVSPVLHQEIVDRAATLILGINNDPAYNVLNKEKQS